VIVCKACGNRNADREEFCSSCGRYLAWSGEHVDEPEEEVAPEVEPEKAPVVPRRPGLVERVRTAIGVPPRQPGEPDSPDSPAPSGSDGSFVRVLPDEARDAPSDRALDTGVVPVVPASGGGDAMVTGLELGTTTHVVDVDAHPGEGTLASPVAVATAAEEQLGASASDAVPDASGLVTLSSSVPVTAQVPAVTPRRPGDPIAHAVAVVAPDIAPEEPPSASAERGSVLRRPTEMQGAAHTARKRTAPADIGRAPAGPQPGDVFCHRCDQFNSPTRTFCRRCGEELHPELAPGMAPKYKTLDFWQRHVHRDVQITAAGKRPGRWGRAVSGGGGQGLWIRIMTRGLAGLAGILLILSFIGPAAQPIRNWYTNLYRSLVHKVDITYTQVFAIGANATSQIPTHPASYAVDDATNTYWQAKPTPHAGAGQAIVVVFAQPTNVDRIGILSGAGPTQQAFLKETAPKEVVLTFTGRTSHYTIHEHLQDTRNFQRLAVAAKNVTSMTMHIISVYPSPLKSKSVAVTEIEFFQRT
jgi:hypothetical protein